MNSPQEVGNIIKTNRIKLNLTQKELAKLLFVEETTVSRWECGLGYPSTNLFDSICDVLNISLSCLLGDESKSYYKNKLIRTIIFLVFSTVILILLFIRNHLFDEDNIVLDILSLVSISSLIAVLSIELIYSLKKKLHIYPYICSFVICYFSSLLSIFSMYFANEIIHYIFLNLVCLPLTFYLAIELFNNVSNKIFNKKLWWFLRIIMVLFLLPISLFFYYSLGVVGLKYSIELLFIFFYIFGIILNIVPFLYFYKRFLKKRFVIFALIAFVTFTTIFILQFLNIRFLDILFDIIIYLGIANSMFVYFVFTKEYVYEN